MRLAVGEYLTIDVRVENDVAVVHLTGELDLCSVPLVELPVGALCERGLRGVIVDLTALEFMDAAGVDVLLRLRSALWAGNTRFIVVRPVAYTVRKVMELTGMDSVLDLRSSVEDALMGDFG